MRRELRHSKPLKSLEKKFQSETTRTLKTQDAVLSDQTQLLEYLVEKLEAPVLNGGFEDLTQKLTRMETMQEGMVKSHEKTATEVAEIHKVINDPKDGLVVTVNNQGKWIGTAKKVLIWMGGLAVTGGLAILGKLLWSAATGHIHFTP